MKKRKDVCQVVQQPDLQKKEEFWTALEVKFTPHASSVLDGTELAADHAELFQSVVSHVEEEISQSEPAISTQLLHVALQLRHFLLNEHVPKPLQHQIARVLALWCTKSLVHLQDLFVPTFRYFLTTSLDKQTVVNVKQLWTLHTCFQNVDLEDELLNDLMSLLMNLLDSEFFLSLKEGQNIMAFMMCQYPAFIEPFHKRIKTVLLSCSKKHASNFGNVYSRALNNANPDTTKVIEEVCLSDLVLCALQCRRQALYMSKQGQQLICVLFALHSNRNHTSICMALVNTYEPVLWRFVSSCNNIHRCNAAELLLNLYPLQYPGGQSMRNRMLLEKQHKTISKLLLDSCHIVRIIATRDICRILCEFWPSIPARFRDHWLKLLIQDLSVDASSIAVRRSVYRYLSELLKNETAAAHLGILLPTLYQQIHDSNPHVRKTFVTLLKKIKTSGHLQFSSIVPAEHLVARLAVEDKRVGKELVSLIFNNILVPKQSIDERVKRIRKLAGCNLNAMRNFFNYSEHELDRADAVNLIENILVYILHTVLGNKENSATEGAEATLDMQVLRGLLDTVSILWILHAKDESKEKLNRLHMLLRLCFPRLFHICRNSDRGMLSSLLFLGSLVPMRVIKKVSTVSGYCMSQLKKLQMDADIKESCLMWVSPLCSWGRAADILGIVMEWLNEAFRTQDLNTTATDRSAQTVQRKVHFQREESKPLVALHVLDAVFTHQPNRCAVLSKNRDLVYELWVYLERTKIAIEMRLEGTLDSPLLTDEFLELCLLRYAKLIVLLGKAKDDRSDPFDSRQHLLDLLVWAHQVLFPHIPETVPTGTEETPLAVTLLCDLVSVSDALIAVGEADMHFVTQVLKFTNLLLGEGDKDRGGGLMFVQSAACLLHRILKHCEVYYRCADRQKQNKEKKTVFETEIPLVVHRMLIAFKRENYTQAMVAEHIKNMGAVRAILTEVLHLSLQCCGAKSRTVCNILTNSVDAVVGITMNDIDETETVEPARSVQSLPYLAANLVCVFRQDEVLSVLFVCMFARRIRIQYSKDAWQLVSAIHVLHVLVHDPGIMCTRDLQTAAKSAATALKKIKSDRSANLSIASTMMASINEKLRM